MIIIDYSTKAALQLHQYGYIPQPLNGKAPITKAWQSRWLDNPMTEKDITNKVVNFSNKNIGILTGKGSNCIVVDIDSMKTYTELIENHGLFPETPTVKTNRGLHLHFEYDETIPSCTPIEKVDILSDKKQVVAPPSIHPESGVPYKWLISPKDTKKAKLPPWLVEIIHNHNKKPRKNKPSTKQLYRKKDAYKSLELDELTYSVDWMDFYADHTTNMCESGEWVSCTCPFHNDTESSFGFNVIHGGWTCFAGCGSGSGIQAIQKLYNVSFKQALKIMKGETIYV